jgi:hypothetical protein
LLFAQRFIFAKRLAAVEMIREFVVRERAVRRRSARRFESSPSSSPGAATAPLRENVPRAERRRRKPKRPRFQRLPTRNPRPVRRNSPNFANFADFADSAERFARLRVALFFVPFHRDSPFSFVYLRATTVAPLFSLFLTFRSPIFPRRRSLFRL